MPLDLLEVYETTDRNYLLYAAAVVDKVIVLRSEAMRKADQGGR